MATVETFTDGSRIATVGDFFALLKPRVMSLVVFTALLCIAVGAGASGALNMAYDSDIDGRMSRTATRPIPMGHLSRGDALGFGWSLSIGSVALMGLFFNFLAAGLLAFTILFYVGVYTLWLKRRTAQNIVIGGLAGALPPAIGWVAVTGNLSLAPLVLVLITFLWTPAHFWALALYRSDDYARVNVPMMPVVKGKASTRRQILAYAIATFVAGLLPAVIGLGGPLYLGAAVLVGLWFVIQAGLVLRERDEVQEPAARRLFVVSIFYLFVLFAALICEHIVGIAPLHVASLGMWM